MFSTTDLLGPLSERGIKLSSSQVYRLVVERPERLSLKILMALLDILDCDMADLIEPVAAAGLPGRPRQPAAGQGVGDLRPKRARIAPAAVTAPAEALADPAGTVVSLVTAADPALEHDLVRRIVEQVGGGRSKRRRLAVELAGDPSVLTTGRSPASKVAGDLMLALRAAGATGISPPWCADCGRRVTSMQRRGEHWYCAPCFVRPEDCAGCGNTRQVAFRDRQGRPRCSQCPDQDTRDPLLALVEVIVMTDPGLPAEAAAAAIEATVTKQAHLQKLAWLLHDKPGLLTGDGAKAPFPVVLRLIDALCEAGATRIRRPACPRCQRVIIAEQATRRAEDLPELLCPRPRRPLREMRDSTRAGRP